MRPFGKVGIPSLEAQHTGGVPNALTGRLKSLDGKIRVAMEAQAMTMRLWLGRSTAMGSMLPSLMQC